jgi:hypothetical protein
MRLLTSRGYNDEGQEQLHIQHCIRKGVLYCSRCTRLFRALTA